ncbi:alpha/beta fold hydrolase [Pseudoclavibacter helvolus]|uniref:esterase/lipase family protein n=1 Tax=Pseudoclavibacter helvolus TaxID=255205 RepID=UPI003D1564C8
MNSNDQHKTPIVLIHGLWMTPTSWNTWAEYFRARGHEVIVPGWPGIDDRSVADIRRNPAALKGVGLAQIADHYERIIRTLPEKPIIMGHSFGGLLTQMLADRDLGVAYVGVPPRPASRHHDAALLHRALRLPRPPQPVQQERGVPHLEGALPLHVWQRPQPRRVGQALGGVRRQLSEQGLLRRSRRGLQREGRRKPRRLRPQRPGTPARHHGRDRPRCATRHRAGDRQEVHADGQPRDGRVPRVRETHAPHRQPDRMGRGRRVRAHLGHHPRRGADEQLSAAPRPRLRQIEQ